mgnify:CR=1 FL=1|tara:strand:+ start:33899 stop:34747 length:849 start_codon:yes stop_codon:yes gene_type:complete
MTIQIPNPGTGNGATGDNEFVLWSKVKDNFNDQTNAANRLVGTANGNVPAYSAANGLSSLGYGGKCAQLANATNLFSKTWVTGFYNANNLVNAPNDSSGWFFIEAIAGTQADRVTLRLTHYVSGDTYISMGDNGVETSWSAWNKAYTTKNTTIEAGTGYLVASSPVLKVQHNSFEKVHEAEKMDIAVENPSVGVYEITGTTGLRENDGWNLKPPKDINGNVLCICEVTQDGEVITLKTYKKKFDSETASIVADYEQPTDIPDGAEVMLRFNDLPAEPMPQGV